MPDKCQCCVFEATVLAYIRFWTNELVAFIPRNRIPLYDGKLDGLRTFMSININSCRAYTVLEILFDIEWIIQDPLTPYCSCLPLGMYQ